MTEIPAAFVEPMIVVHARPRRAGIVAAIQPAGLRIDDCIDARGAARRNGQPNLAKADARETLAEQLRPRQAVVVRDVQPASRAVRGRVGIPGRPARLPKRGIDRRAIRRCGEIDRAGVRIVKENARPRRAAIGRPIHAAFLVWRISMTERSHQQRAGIMRVDEDATDLPRSLESDRPPGGTGIGRSIHSVAVDDVGAHVGFAAPDIHGLGIARRNRDRADRGHRLRIHDREPGAPGIRGFPDTTADRTEVSGLRIAGDAGRRERTATAKRSDRAPAEIRHARRVETARRRDDARSGQCEKRDGAERDEQTTSHAAPFAFPVAQPSDRPGTPAPLG